MGFTIICKEEERKLKYRYAMCTVLTVLSILINLSSWLSEAAAQNVDFPDANLAAAVRDALNLDATDPITQTDLEGLVSLLARGAGIRDLTGLEMAINLTRLGLGSNQITDIRALSGLTNLTHLGLGSNRIGDIRVLSGLTNLMILSLGNSQVTDIRPLSGLTNLQWLDISFNPITDLNPLSNLLKLEEFFIDSEFDEKNPGVLARIIPAHTQIYFLYPTNPGVPVLIGRERLSREELTRKIAPRCGLGWTPQSQYVHPLEQPKVMMYALEFEYSQHGYTCSAIEIRTGDATISHLDGWQLYLGTLYNPSRMPLELTQANSQITNGVLRLTSDMLGLEAFPCNTVGGISHPLPGMHYVLKTDANLLVDTAYSCFIWGQNAYTTVDGINVKSQRRISSAALREMQTPRMERYITDPTNIFITYTGIEEFGWDRVILSDWLLASSEGMEVAGGNAPSSPYKKLTTSWAALKQPEILHRNEKRK